MKKTNEDKLYTLIIIVVVGIFALIINGNISMVSVVHGYHFWQPFIYLFIELALMFTVAGLILVAVQWNKRQAKKR